MADYKFFNDDEIEAVDSFNGSEPYFFDDSEIESVSGDDSSSDQSWWDVISGNTVTGLKSLGHGIMSGGRKVDDFLTDLVWPNSDEVKKTKVASEEATMGGQNFSNLWLDDIEKQNELNESLGGAKGIIGNITQGVSSIAPTLLFGGPALKALGAGGKAIVAIPSLISGTSTGVNTYDDAVSKGYDEDDAKKAALISGAFDTVTNLPIAKMAKGAAGKWIPTLAEGYFTNAANGLGQTWARDVGYGEDYNPGLEEYLGNANEAGLTGLGMSAAAKTVGDVGNYISNRRIAKKVAGDLTGIEDKMDLMADTNSPLEQALIDADDFIGLDSDGNVVGNYYDSGIVDSYRLKDELAAKENLFNNTTSPDDFDMTVPGMESYRSYEDLTGIELPRSEKVPDVNLEADLAKENAIQERMNSLANEGSANADDFFDDLSVRRVMKQQGVDADTARSYLREMNEQKAISDDATLNDNVVRDEFVARRKEQLKAEAESKAEAELEIAKEKAIEKKMKSMAKEGSANVDDFEIGKNGKPIKTKVSQYQNEISDFRVTKEGDILEAKPSFYEEVTDEYVQTPIVEKGKVIGVERKYKDVPMRDFDEAGNEIDNIIPGETKRIFFNEVNKDPNVDTYDMGVPGMESSKSYDGSFDTVPDIKIIRTETIPAVEGTAIPENKTFNSVADFKAHESATARQNEIAPVITKVEQKAVPAENFELKQGLPESSVKAIDNAETKLADVKNEFERDSLETNVTPKTKVDKALDKVAREELTNLNNILKTFEKEGGASDAYKAELNTYKERLKNWDKDPYIKQDLQSKLFKKEKDWWNNSERGAVVNPADLALEAYHGIKSYFRDVMHKNDVSAAGGEATDVGQSLGDKFFDGSLWLKRNNNGQIISGSLYVPGLSHIVGFMRKVFSMPSTLAARFPEFKDVYKAGQNVIQLGSENLNTFAEPYTTFITLPKESQLKIGNAMSHARELKLQGKNFVETKQNWMNVGLSEVEAEVALDLRNAFNLGLEKIREGQKAEAKLAFKKLKENPAAIQNMLNKRYQEIDAWVDGLKDTNYTPFSRRGKYYVDCPEADFFYMSDSLDDISRVTKELNAKGFKGKQIQRGTMKKNFKDEMLIQPRVIKGIENYKPIQGFEKHFAKAKGTAGYSTDYARNFAEYFTELSNWHSNKVGEMGLSDAIDAMPRTSDQLISYANKYKQDIFKSTPKALGGLKSLAALYSLSNPTTALVNFTQPLTMTMPECTRYLGLKGGNAAMLKGTMLQWQYTKNEKAFRAKHKDLAEAMDRAGQRGVLDAGQADVLRDAAKGVGKARNALELTHLGLFGLAEKVNRKNAFMVGWTVAEKTGLKDIDAKYNFAEKFVEDTQFNYNKADRPVATRGWLSLPTMFKLYSGCMFRALSDGVRGDANYKKATMQRLLTMASLGGVSSVPFVASLGTLVGGSTGYDIQAETRNFLRNIFGPNSKIADIFTYGIPYLVGANTKVNMAAENHLEAVNASSFPKLAESIGQLTIGPAMSLISDAFSAKNLYNQGRTAEAVGRLLPKLERNVLAAYAANEDNAFRTVGGLKIGDKPTTRDLIYRGLGMQPMEMGDYYEAKNSTFNPIFEREKNKDNIVKAAGLVEQYRKGKGDPQTVYNQFIELVEKECEEKGREPEKVIESIKNRLIKNEIGEAADVQSFTYKKSKFDYVSDLAKKSPKVLLQALKKDPDGIGPFLDFNNGDVRNFMQTYRDEISELLQ